MSLENSEFFILVSSFLDRSSSLRTGSAHNNKNASFWQKGSEPPHQEYKGFYQGISPGVTHLLATAATYFAVIVIDSTKTWLEWSTLILI